MKLLIVTQTVDRDDQNLGAFYCWFEELARRAESLVIIADTVGSHDFLGNVAVHSLGKDRGMRPLARLWKFWELFSREYAACDVVLFHQIPEFALAGAPFLVLLTRTRALWYAHKSITWRLRLAERLVDYVFSSSPEGFRMPSKKVIFTGQAINTELFKPTANSKQSTGAFLLRLITVGRIAPVKNYEIILRACALLTEQMPGRDWRLTIVGGPLLERDQTYYNYLKRLAGELELGDRVEFAGPRPYSEIPAILREHDMFLNASATGSLDKAVLEAMACGLWVITANEAYRRIVPTSSFLERASPEAFAGRVAAFASEPRPNPELREIVLRDHGLERMIEKMLSVLQTPLSPTGPLRPIKMLYVVNARMPTEKAHGIQIAKMCEALIEHGVDLELVVPGRSASLQSLREFYGLRRDIPLQRLPVLDFYVWGRAGFLIASVSFIFSYIFFVFGKRMRGWRGVIYTTDIDQFSFVGIPLTGLPYVMELHDAKPFRRRWRWFLRSASCLVVINDFIKEKVIGRFGIPAERVAVHPNGIDYEFFSLPIFSRFAELRAAVRREYFGISGSTRMAIYVGRAYPWKGIDILVEAARALEADGIDVWVVGATPDEIRDVSGITDLPQNFNAAGSKPHFNIPLLLSAADVCVVLGTFKSDYSYYYTSPMKIFEYMAAGKPIVASGTPANREILSDEEAFFYEPDNAADLAEKIKYVFENPDEAARRVRAARKKVRQWTWEKRAAEVIAHINRWLL